MKVPAVLCLFVAGLMGWFAATHLSGWPSVPAWFFCALYGACGLDCVWHEVHKAILIRRAERSRIRWHVPKRGIDEQGRHYLELPAVTNASFWPKP
jgi:hypothetical protein